jgi:hypothetical protein
VVEVLDEDVQNDELLAVLAEYRKPVEFVDETMGKFELDKNLELFNGEIDWLGKKIPASLEVNADNKGSWTKAAKMLRALFGQREGKDAEFRAFAADRLTDLANDWRQEEESAEISKKDFIGRMSLSELSVTSGGNFTAYYDDDDMFGGHVIMVSGSLKKGVKSADIAG